MEKRIRKKVNTNRGEIIVALSFILLMMLGLPARAEDPDYGNDCNSAEPIDPNGTIVEGILSDTSDHDWFSFTAVADGLYEMTFLSQSGKKYMYVYGPDGCPGSLQQIASIYNSGGGTVINEVFIESPGTYYIGVPYESPYYSSTGLYRVSVNLLSEYPTDTYPDTCTSPAVLIVDDPPVYDGITDLGTDEDWLTFSTSILHKYRVSFYRPLNTDVVYGLHESGCGGQLYSGTASRTFVSWDGANYDLMVRSSSFNKEGYYEIWVEDLGEVPDDYNNTCDGATPIPTDGTEVEGRLQYTADLFTDEDWFSFTAAADGLYEMTFLSQSGTKYMYVYGPDGCPGELQQIASIYNSGGGTVINEVFIEHPGTYYIKVPYYNSTGLYRVSVNELGTYPTDTYSGTCDDPCELVVDDPCGPVYDGITDYGMDEDWFTFATTVLHKYQVSFYRPLITDVVYGLHESGCGGQLYSGTASRTFVSWDGANYDLRVKSSSFNKEGYYEIWVDDLGEVLDDYGNTCDVATPIATNGTEVEGRLQYTADLFTDEDWFSFTAAADGLYEMTFLSQSGTKYMYVYGPDGCPGELQQIASIYNSGGGTVINEVFIESPGTYYIKVPYYNSTGLYQVSVLSPEPQCGDPLHPYPEGDMNHDCVVNFKDIATIANNWLADNRPPP